MAEKTKRNQRQFIFDYLKKDGPHPVLLISGARQVGKSTLVESCLQNRPHLICNLYEEPDLARRIDQTKNFNEFERLLLTQKNFLPSQDTVLVIDEAQEAKKIGQWIRFFKEKWHKQKVILLGSILSNLFLENKSYPVGRVVELVLRPYDFYEYLLATHRDGLAAAYRLNFEKQRSGPEHELFWQAYLEYLQVGGMPEIVCQFASAGKETNLNWDQLIVQYAIDIERYLGTKLKNLFLTAIQRIAAHTCQPLKYSQILSTDSEFYRSIPKLLEVIEGWHLVLRSSPLSKALESSSGKASKRYLFDLGLTNLSLQRGSRHLFYQKEEFDEAVFAKLQENFVALELASHRGDPNELSFYRSNKDDREIDFIFQTKRFKLPIEVKSQKTINRNTLLPMTRYLEEQKLKTGLLIYSGPKTQLELHKKEILAIPPYELRNVLRQFDE